MSHYFTNHFPSAPCVICRAELASAQSLPVRSVINLFIQRVRGVCDRLWTKAWKSITDVPPLMHRGLQWYRRIKNMNNALSYPWSLHPINRLLLQISLSKATARTKKTLTRSLFTCSFLKGFLKIPHSRISHTQGDSRRSRRASSRTHKWVSALTLLRCYISLLAHFCRAPLLETFCSGKLNL